MAMQQAVNLSDLGSSPGGGAYKQEPIPGSVTGNTTDFESVIPRSNRGWGTCKIPQKSSL